MHASRFLPRAIALAVAAAVLSTAAVAAPAAAKPLLREIGPAAASKSVTVSVALKNRDADGLRRLIDDLHTPGNAQYHRFLSPAEFHRRFDPAPEAVASATAYFRAAGLAVARRGHLLDVTGSPAAMRKAFGVELREFEIAANGHVPGGRYLAARGEPAIASAAVADSINAVLGLDQRPSFVPNHLQRPAALGGTQSAAAARAAVAADGAGTPGYWTPKDVASYYDADPLYDQGFHGEGRTIGIVTLASFSPADAYRYWADNGISSAPDRIREVQVQGGAGPIVDGPSGETTLDVQQSGGVAPAANIVVYEAPNSTRAFVDAFYRAVEDNEADTISVSWGAFEWLDTLERMHAHKSNALILKAFSQVFMQAAVQGQTLIAASGDAGAFEANNPNEAPLPFFLPVLSVGAPGESAYITAAGGTTLPGTQRFMLDGKPYLIDVPAERAWGWDYLVDLCGKLGMSPTDCGVWGAGSGGGVSSFIPVPQYQKRVAGMHVTEAGQSLVEVDVTPPIDYVDLPAGFAGRNVPDISLNADPNTGLTVGYTDRSGNYGISAFNGGTSFVAPQLNGFAALVSQKVGGRIGLLNYPMYAMARKAKAWGHDNSPFKDVTAGANWYYEAVAGYDASTGLGTLDVANFADALIALQPK